MLGELFAEGLGTFFFLGVILASGGNVVTIAAGLAASIFLVSKFSGANLNPAVSVMLYAKGDMTLKKTVSYILVQVLGGLAALIWYQMTMGLVKA